LQFRFKNTGFMQKKHHPVMIITRFLEGGLLAMLPFPNQLMAIH